MYYVPAVAILSVAVRLLLLQLLLVILVRTANQIHQVPPPKTLAHQPINRALNHEPKPLKLNPKIGCTLQGLRGQVPVNHALPNILWQC